MFWTISPERALQGRSWAIVSNRDGRVYSLYREPDEATRICHDLNVRYGDGAYAVAHVERPTATHVMSPVSDGVGECTCSACGGHVGPHDAWCRGCGCELVGTEYPKGGTDGTN